MTLTNWTLVSERPPLESDYPIIAGGWSKNDGRWTELYCTQHTRVEFHPDWSHWRSIKVAPPERIKTRQEMDLEIGRKVMNESIYGSHGKSIDDMCAAAVKAGREDFARQINTILNGLMSGNRLNEIGNLITKTI